MNDFRLLPWRRWELRSEYWWFLADVSGQLIGRSFQGSRILLVSDVCTFMKISCWIFLIMRNVSDGRSRENQTHNLYSIDLFTKFYIWVSVHHKSIIYINQQDATLAVLCLLKTTTTSHILAIELYSAHRPWHL